MRSLAESIITTAAVAAGVPEAAVMDEPDKQRSAILPKPRLEIGWLPEDLVRDRRRLARLPRPATPEEDTHAVTRWVVYRRTLRGRLTLRTEDGDSLETMSRAFLLALPKSAPDADGNLVTIRADKAVRGGFNSRVAEPLPERSCAIHVSFAGWLCRDESTPWIKQVTFNDPVTFKGVPKHDG